MALILTAVSLFCNPFCIISIALVGALKAETIKSDAAPATTSWFDSRSNSQATGNMSATWSSDKMTIDFTTMASGEWKLSFTYEIKKNNDNYQGCDVGAEFHILSDSKNGKIRSSSSPKCGTLTWWGGLSGLIKY